MRFLTLFSLLLLFVACDNNTVLQEELTNNSPIEVQLSENPQWEKDHLRLLPIVASEAYLNEQQSVAQYKVLSEALENERFRVSEKKPYGRFTDEGAVNTLTVQNKTEDPIFLMAGEVVQGGNQDRVIAEDAVIAARNIQDIPVFCVEHGRWTYEGDKALNEGDKKIFAFRGYYNVASSEVRRSVATGSQQAVWDQVADIRTRYSLDGGTQAYADLETNEKFVNDRTNYERFFGDKLAKNETIIGFVAVSGDQILGADVFGHPALLNRQFAAVLSSYATDALTLGNDKELKPAQLAAFIAGLQADLADEKGFRQDGKLVHYAKLR
ncbi:DUF6569 family protein [Lewinella sp. LCG006]|uniref:ARPP-1 family domain-containing protein n=1 Tax=Lewinella sp. LCG006 TaxID=3231911 RepID=UPI00345F4E24